MEVRHLVYTGKEVDKEIVVRQEPPLSKFRKLKVYPGLRYEIGKDIPEKTSRRIMEMLGMMFKVEVEDLDDLETFKKQFREVIDFYTHRFGIDALAVVPSLTVEALFSVMGDDAMETLMIALRESDEIEMSEKQIADVFNSVFKIERKKPKKTVKRRKKE